MPNNAAAMGLVIGGLVVLWSLSAAGIGGADRPAVAAVYESAALALLATEEPIQSRQPDGVRLAGSECPTGSGNYCSDELPYCCPGVSGEAYCAADVNGCTQ